MLWRMTRDMDDAQATPSKTAKRDETPAPAKAAPSASGGVAARDPWLGPKATVPVKRPSGGGTSTAPAGEAAPAVPSNDPAEVKRLETRGWLRTQQLATEQDMVACVDKATKAGVKLDGVIAYPLVVSRKDGKVVTESGNVDYTTLGDGDVTACIGSVMKKMAYEELPEGVSSVTSYRKLTIKDGVVVEDWLGPHTTEDAKPSPR